MWREAKTCRTTSSRTFSVCSNDAAAEKGNREDLQPPAAAGGDVPRVPSGSELARVLRAIPAVARGRRRSGTSEGKRGRAGSPARGASNAVRRRERPQTDAGRPETGGGSRRVHRPVGDL